MRTLIVFCLLAMSVAANASVVIEAECITEDVLGIEPTVRVTGARCGFPPQTGFPIAGGGIVSVTGSSPYVAFNVGTGATSVGEAVPGTEGDLFPRARFVQTAQARVEVDDQITFYGVDPAFIRFRAEVDTFIFDASYGYSYPGWEFRVNGQEVDNDELFAPLLFAHGRGQPLRLHVIVTGRSYSPFILQTAGMSHQLEIGPIELLDENLQVLSGYRWSSTTNVPYILVGGSAVPEPSTMILAALPLLALLKRRWRRG